MVITQGGRRRIVVFGGTSGIGLACAERLARREADLWAVSRSPQRAEKRLAALSNVRLAAVDAVDDSAVQDFFKQLGFCDDVIVSMAGGAYIGPFTGLGDEELDRSIGCKLRGYIHVARAALAVLAPSGSLTLVTGLTASRPVPGAATLALLNGALESLVLTLAVECAPRRVNAVSPGTTATPAWDRLPTEARRSLFDGAAARTPLGRAAASDDIAAAVAALLDAPFVTGVVLPCDGGARLA